MLACDSVVMPIHLKGAGRGQSPVNAFRVPRITEFREITDGPSISSVKGAVHGIGEWGHSVLSTPNFGGYPAKRERARSRAERS